MAKSIDRDEPSAARAPCPEWCTTRHGLIAGEDDWLHQGEELIVTEDITARLCMTIEPTTGETDGPYVLIGSQELAIEAATRLGERLLAMTRTGSP